MLREFGVAVSLSSVTEFYRHLIMDLTLHDLAKAQKTMERVNAMGPNLRGLEALGWKLIGERLLEKPAPGGDVKALVALARLLARQEYAEIQRRRLEQARLKFQAEKAILLPSLLPGPQARKYARVKRN